MKQRAAIEFALARKRAGSIHPQGWVPVETRQLVNHIEYEPVRG